MTRSGGRRLSGAAAGVVAALALSACIVDVGTAPGYPELGVWDVNESGTTLASGSRPGIAPGDPGETQVFIVDADNTWIALRPATSGNFPDNPTAINDDGTVVGTAFLRPGEPACPFLLVPGQDAQCIDDRQVEVLLTWPNDINEDGAVVGYGSELQPGGGYGGPVPALWTPSGGTRSLPLPAGDTAGQATAINDRGQIVGFVGPTAFDQRAVLWCPPSYQPIELAPDSPTTTAIAVNDRGVILGTRFDPSDGTFDTVIWDETAAHEARTLPEGTASDLDGSGAPVGAVTRNGATVAARFDPRTLQPELLAPVDGRSSRAIAAADDQIGGWISTDDGLHVARFVRNLEPD